MSDNNDRERGIAHGAEQMTNVKPQLQQRDRSRDKHDQGKEEPPKVQTTVSTDSKRGRSEGKRARGQERNTKERKEHKRGEGGQKRERRDGGNKRKSSDALEDDVNDTECVVCFCSYDNMFKTPKLLSCGHTFCLECLARINVSSPELKTLSCPVCREQTKLPHGRDLPHLNNNEDIFHRLPSGMQRALSVRFKRSKGKLMLKKPLPSTTSQINPSLTLPTKKQKGQSVIGTHLQLGTVEQGIAPATVVDVGRPPNRVRGCLHGLFRSNRCYYAVVVTIIAITVALMLVGILAFVIMPRMVGHSNNPSDVNSHPAPITAHHP